jgi:hypothetical protein
VAVALVLAALAAVALVRHGGVVVDAARARTAADAAALAGGAEGREAAARVAAANGGTLVDLHVEGVEVQVEVRVGEVRARARARREGTWCGGEGRAPPAISYTAPPCPSSQG